jgi:hypothetical protein
MWIRRPKDGYGIPPARAEAWPAGVVGSLVVAGAALPIFGLSVTATAAIVRLRRIWTQV